MRMIDHPRRAVITTGLLFLAACSRGPEPKKPAAAPAPEPIVYTEVDPNTAATLTGKILFTGKAPARTKIDMDEDPQCARLHSSAVYDDPVAVGRGGGLANVFVYIKRGLEGKHFHPPAQAAVIDQHGCWFQPRVLGIETGQTLDVTNSDPVTHNIHPRAHLNREWNQSQSAGAAPLARRFIRPEIMIRVKCNIHGWMKAWIGVVDNPYFAVTAMDGTFEIRNLAPGSYTIAAWQEELGTLEQEVNVAPSGKAALTFTFRGE
jgi:plastocyanin